MKSSSKTEINAEINKFRRILGLIEFLIDWRKFNHTRILKIFVQSYFWELQ